MHEVAEGVDRPPHADAAAAVDDRPLARGEQRAGLLQGRRIAQPCRRGGPPGRRARLGLRLRDVLGQVDEHRAGPALAGDAEGLGHDVRQVVGRADQEAVLDDRHEDAEHVHLLEGVGAQRAARHLSGDGHDRHRVEMRVGDAGEQVGGPGSRRGHADADPAGGAGVAVGGQGRALLVAHQDVPQARAEQRVVDRHDGAAGVAEDDVDALVLERFDEQAGAAPRRLGRRRGVRVWRGR